MAKKSRVAAVETEAEEIPLELSIESIEAPAPSAAAEPESWYEETPLPSTGRRWPAIVGAIVSIALVVAWSAVVVMANPAMLGGTAPLGQWIVWVRDWSLPVLLLAALWMMALHSSRQEAIRIARSARALGDETLALEARLKTINRELSLAREFLASQSRDLETLGRVAAERLTGHSEKLAALIAENGQRAETVSEISSAALDNMEKLRDQLPVIANSARDVTNNIAAAGRSAHSQLEDMVGGFNKLNEFGQASERQITALRETVDTAIHEFAERTERLEKAARETFAALDEQGAQFDVRLERRQNEALQAIRARAEVLGEELENARATLATNENASLDALHGQIEAIRHESATLVQTLRDSEERSLDAWKASVARLEESLRSAVAQVGDIDRQATEAARERRAALAEEQRQADADMAERNRLFETELESRRAAFDARHREFIEDLTAQMDAFETRLAGHRAVHEAHSSAVAGNAESLSARLEDLSQAMAQAATQGDDAEARIAASLATLNDKLASSGNALADTDRAITALTDSSVRLLELIQASADHSVGRLPEAIAVSETRLAGLEDRVKSLRASVAEAEAGGVMLDNHIDKARRELAQALEQIVEIEGRIASQTGTSRENLAAMERALSTVRSESLMLAETAQEELRKAIAELNGSARAAVGGIEGMGVAAISSLASKLSEESGAAIDKVMRARAAEVAGHLEEAAARAAEVGRESAIQLRDQLAKVSELTGHLERRVAHARAQAEEQVDNDFSRRMALITESLNSNAIDIAKVMDADIADTAWAAYLKGDRGVFTRRAARLFEGPQSRAVMQLYTSDPTFRELVSRYVHDFESMLRQVLSTRDGNALGVTLLSSDMGKLYVALAQAIERLRE